MIGFERIEMYFYILNFFIDDILMDIPLIDPENTGVKIIDIATQIGNFNVWTKTLGKNPRIKVLLLPGGPGLTHEYLECFESYLPQNGFEMIEYDPLDCHFSDQPNDKSLWTIHRFGEEVEQVRQALGLHKDNFYLLGHSFGAAIAMQYALKYQENLKGLIVCNMMASFPEYNKFIKILRMQMSRQTIEQLKLYEREGLFKDAGYQTLVIQELYIKYISVLPEFPEPLLRTLSKNNNAISEVMLGESPLNVNGTMMDWDIGNKLKNIRVPTLVVGAKNDNMNPEYLKWMSNQYPNGHYLYCENGSHLAMWDDQQTFMTGIINFINDVDTLK